VVDRHCNEHWHLIGLLHHFDGTRLACHLQPCDEPKLIDQYGSMHRPLESFSSKDVARASRDSASRSKSKTFSTWASVLCILQQDAQMRISRYNSNSHGLPVNSWMLSALDVAYVLAFVYPPDKQSGVIDRCLQAARTLGSSNSPGSRMNGLAEAQTVSALSEISMHMLRSMVHDDAKRERAPSCCKWLGQVAHVSSAVCASHRCSSVEKRWVVSVAPVSIPCSATKSIFVALRPLQGVHWMPTCASLATGSPALSRVCDHSSTM